MKIDYEMIRRDAEAAEAERETARVHRMRAATRLSHAEAVQDWQDRLDAEDAAHAAAEGDPNAQYAAARAAGDSVEDALRFYLKRGDEAKQLDWDLERWRLGLLAVKTYLGGEANDIPREIVAKIIDELAATRKRTAAS